MRHGIYNSPVPATFVRSGCRRPTPDEPQGPHHYISLIITSAIAGGATGHVHAATLEFLSLDNKSRNLPAAVKFAFEPQQKQRMRHEFSIYQHLAVSGIKGIPVPFGLFEDLESDTLALLMTHTGSSLTTLHPEDLQIKISEPQRFVTS
jgi:hypothetical protein